MKNKVRISSKNKQILPERVAEKIQEVGEDFRIHSFTIEPVDANKVFFLGEGYRFWGVVPDGKEAEFEVVSESSLGTAGLSHQIGARFNMPAGSYLILVYYYTKYFMTVYQVQNLLN